MLTAADREEISRGIAQDQPGVVIAAQIGRDPSVVSREIARHGGRHRYRASRAARVAARARRRPKTRKLDADPTLRAAVLARLRAGWSPDQIAGRLRHEPQGAQAGWVAGPVSHEAIYTWLYALPKGELARQGILLRSGRTSRRPRGRTRAPGARIVGMHCIDDRPAEVTDRRVPGHWEGDLMIGRAGRSAMATLVERTSRYTVPVALPAGRRDATTTCDALIDAVTGMPTQLTKTLTWDQGSEMAAHAAFSLATNVEVYFAHPHSPWERGTNENTNRLLREYFPKGTDITDDQNYLDLVARELNNRPRRTLGYRTPAEVFTDLLASEIASTS
jgi:transposase, IS30 family